MTIKLPKELEHSVRAEVLKGHFASEDDFVAEAVRTYLNRQRPADDLVEPSTQREQVAPDDKPIWEVIEEISASIPDEVWDDVPTDLAAQHDHYLYGTPKRTDI